MAGHGWVKPNPTPNGMVARCGGPEMCSVCQAERAVLAAKRKPLGDFPRRGRLDCCVPAELAIREIVEQIEHMGADTLLTDAQMLLSQAREKVADWVDKVGAS